MKFGREACYHPGDVFLSTILVDPGAPYHKFLLGRAAKETMTYGTMPLYKWYNFFCMSCLPSIELRYLSGIVKHIERYAKRPPFIIKQKRFLSVD